MNKDKERGYAQYIVVRKDLVEQMGHGKLAAQVAHASLAVLLDKVKQTNTEGNIVEKVVLADSDNIKGWINGRFTKLVVYVKNKNAMLKLAEELEELGIKVKLIFDACYTVLQPEEANGSTLTCLGISPIGRKDVPKCLKKLQLLD